jgi:hypothetical protein
VRRLIRGLPPILALLVGVMIILLFADRIQGLVVKLNDRVGAAWGLGIVGLATLLLWVVWVRYGGVHALRRWGVVLKPARMHEQDDGAAGPGDGPAVERPSQDPQALR